MSELDAAIAELERAAVRLRAEEIEPEEAAELVERCAQLAAEVGGELDRQAAASSHEAPPDQETLL
ncbi:MAG: hypothetical protein QOK25_1928 [Thermoleophilaceae bacterium]|nr:hypothetical protein [Thermoleophilaceae bacterium]